MIDYLSWLLPGTTEEEALRVKDALEKKLESDPGTFNPNIFVHTVLRLTEDHLLKEGDVCLKDGDWEIRDTPLRKGQFCIFYRANLSGQRMAEAILQREKAYQSTLSWLGNEVPEEVLEVVEPVPDTEKAE